MTWYHAIAVALACNFFTVVMLAGAFGYSHHRHEDGDDEG